MTSLSKAPAPPLNFLPFYRLWEIYTSDRVNFEDVIDVKSRSISVVEFRNALTAFRNAALDPNLHNNLPEYVMEQSLSYMAALEYLQDHADDLKERNWLGLGSKQVRIQSKWRSALAKTTTFGGSVQFATAKAEIVEDQSLMLVRYISALWHHVQTKLATVSPPKQENQSPVSLLSDPPPINTEAASSCISLLRKAAGAAAFLSGPVHQRVQQHTDGAATAKVPEAQQWLGAALTTYFMAQAHYTMAYLAMTGSEPKWQLAAKLFHGAHEDFAGADGQVASGIAAGTSVLAEFRELLQLSAAMALARARACAARKLLLDRDAGLASVAAKHAANELAMAGHLVDRDSREAAAVRGGWRHTFECLQAELDKAWGDAENERKYVYGQSLSEARPPAPPSPARPLQPTEFALPKAEYDLDFEKV